MILSKRSPSTAVAITDADRAALKRARLERGWSFEELGRRAGYCPAHLYRAERGTLEPGYSALVRWAKALGFEPDVRLRRVEG